MDDRTGMYLKNRTCDQYLQGLKSFITAAEVDMSTHCNYSYVVSMQTM